MSFPKKNLKAKSVTGEQSDKEVYIPRISLHDWDVPCNDTAENSLTGLLLLLAGVTVLIQNRGYEELVTNKFFAMPSLAIATGIIIFLISGLGFYAAISQQFYFVAGYTASLIVVLILEITVCALAFELYNDAATTIRSTMHQSLLQYSTRIEVARMWDELQMSFECCGVVGRNDWGLDLIPVSCCHIDYGTISPFQCTSANSYSIGCASELGAWLSNNAFSLAVISVIIICIQIIIMAASGWLTWRRSKFEEVELES
ncbi:CD63 antigen [Eumeta japonica]|uniref:CD63 antigen n=1 Tax=Eumeta variegata TaxID=151549 RepID=A0A4C1UI45_EUMVA|nr:CD63 antigen [Eumeta japonica]